MDKGAAMLPWLAPQRCQSEGRHMTQRHGKRRLLSTIRRRFLVFLHQREFRMYINPTCTRSPAGASPTVAGQRISVAALARSINARRRGSLTASVLHGNRRGVRTSGFYAEWRRGQGLSYVGAARRAGDGAAPARHACRRVRAAQRCTQSTLWRFPPQRWRLLQLTIPLRALPQPSPRA